jgi:hypothetical protein
MARSMTPARGAHGPIVEQTLAYRIEFHAVATG